MSAPKHYSKKEELFNTVSHGSGALLGLAGTVVLLGAAGAPGGRAWWGCAVYGFSLTLLYTMSTLYHAFPEGGVKRVFRVFDHCTIYVLITGTYTPILLIALKNSPRAMPVFWILWGLTALGIVLKCIDINRFGKAGVGLCLAMGWAAVFVMKDLAAAVAPAGLYLLVAGGLAYTAGVGFYAVRKPYMHAIWHLFVLAGSIFHYFFILLYVLPAGGVF